MQKKKLKIAIVAYNLEVGGLTKVITTLYNLLNSIDGVSVELLFLDNNEGVDSNISYKSFNSTSQKGRFFQKYLKYIRFKKYLKSTEFDFIIDQRYRVNVVSEILITKYIYTKEKVIYNIHSSQLKTYLPYSVRITKFLYKSAYKIVCCSQAIKDLVKNKYGLSNVTCIYNSLDLNSFTEQKNIALGYKYIVAVGRIEPVKQFDKLIKAYANSILPNKNIKLVIVGNGSQLDTCKRISKKLNLTKKVVFTGVVSKPALYMVNAEFLILCSKYEGFGMVLLESLACSTPVVSFDVVAGPNEIIIPNVNGVLVENQDFESLTRVMNKMIEDDEFLKNCKKEARNSIIRFSNDEIKKTWLELLKIIE